MEALNSGERVGFCSSGLFAAAVGRQSRGQDHADRCCTHVDTAGFRKERKLADSIEFYAQVRARESIAKANLSLGLCEEKQGHWEDAMKYHEKALLIAFGVGNTASAIALARDNNLPIIVFSLDEPDGFRGILAGKGTFTRVQG